jgi:hypothetical protein
MAKTKKNRSFKGGFMEYNGTPNDSWINIISQNASDMWNNVSENAKNIWDRTKQSFQSNQTQSQGNYSYIGNVGGKKRKHIKGGYSSNISLTNTASNAGAASQQTATPQVWLRGGKSKKYYKHKLLKVNKSKKYRPRQ